VEIVNLVNTRTVKVPIAALVVMPVSMSQLHQLRVALSAPRASIRDPRANQSAMTVTEQSILQLLVQVLVVTVMWVTAVMKDHLVAVLLLMDTILHFQIGPNRFVRMMQSVLVD
jgi:hypothetical protein